MELHDWKTPPAMHYMTDCGKQIGPRIDARADAGRSPFPRSVHDLLAPRELPDVDLPDNRLETKTGAAEACHTGYNALPCQRDKGQIRMDSGALTRRQGNEVIKVVERRKQYQHYNR